MYVSRPLVAALALTLLCTVTGRAAEAGNVTSLRRAFRDPTIDHVFVIAHRADWHDAPENSLAGITRCLAMGIDGIEIDLRRTKDGRFVLMHDKTIDRTTTGHGKVGDLTWADVEALRLRDAAGRVTDERVPTLEQAVRATQGRMLIYLDKTEDLIDAVDAEMTRLHAADQALYYGSRTAGELRQRYGPLVDRIVYLPKVNDAIADPAGMVGDLASLRPAAYVLEFAAADSPVFAAAEKVRSAHARVFVSPLWPTAAGGRTDEAALTDPDGNWGWLLDRGVTIFCTDRPAELLQYLRGRGLRNAAIDPRPVPSVARAEK